MAEEQIKVICQLCNEVVAKTSMAVLAFPINGSMFESRDTEHGFPAPWQPYEVWADMRCPFGRIHRAIITEDLILTDQGFVRLPRDGGAAYIDPDASEEIDRQSIPDRTIMVPEEEAARQAREEIYGETEEWAGEAEGDEPVKGETKAGKKQKHGRGR